jgi:preprotein translocase subunit SecD
VKGFALMLLIGTVLSLVTAVAATRAMLGPAGRLPLVRQPRLHGRAGQRSEVAADRRQRPSGAGSSSRSPVAIVVSVVVARVKGLNLGIDFKGGTQITFKTPSRVARRRARPDGAIGRGDAVVQGRGSRTGRRYKSFQIRTKSLTPTQQDTLRTT